MKNTLILLTMTAVFITGCMSTGEIFGDGPIFLKDDSGSILSDCTSYTDYMGETSYDYVTKNEAEIFWEKNNLPKGTLYWLCEGEKPVLPKDCQGNSLTTPQLRQYWKQYNLPRGTDEFNCDGGVPSPK